VVDTLCDRVERNYVFPDLARTATKAIRKRMSARQYDRITSASEFADSLTAHLQAAVPDLHLRVHYRYEPIPAQMDDDGPPPESEQRRMQERSRRLNYGFERVERLPGNVGYLDLRQFSSDPDGQATAVAAMNFLANTDAMIVDLRRNGGGDPQMIATLLTYFVTPGDRLLFNTFYHRAEDKISEYYTSPYVPGPRYTGKPVYVLTSNRTGSAAEEFAYDIQTHELGTLVGAVTAGGANPGGIFRLSDNFAAFIATGRAINPITKTNWEGVGVKPDVAVPAGEAQRSAYERALQALIDAAGDDPDRVQALRETLEEASKRAPDPEEEFVRPRRRRG
jgi:C-terminal processing protease CtpA/Prc